MSVQIFRGVGGSTLNNFNATTGAAANTLYAVQASAKITCPIGDEEGTRRSQTVEWCSQGSSIQEAIDNAADVLQFVVDNSNGYISMFCLQLGLFRSDVEGIPMEAGAISYASISATNTKNASGERVQAVRARNSNLYIPFCKETASKASLKAGVQALCTAGKLCTINFHDANKESFDIGPLTYVYGATIKDYEAKGRNMLQSNDTGSGITDGVIRKTTSSNP